MAISEYLPAKLSSVLTDSNAPIELTFGRFYEIVESVADADRFSIAIHTLNSLNKLDATNNLDSQVFPWRKFEQKSKSSENDYGGQRLSFYLNAEYIIRQLYRDVSIDIHPFLSHWVEFIDNLEAGQSNAPKASTDGGKESVLDDKVVTQIRGSFVKCILNDCISEYVRFCPAEMQAAFENNVAASHVDTGRFRQVLEESGIWDQPTPGDTAGPSRANNGDRQLQLSSETTDELGFIAPATSSSAGMIEVTKNQSSKSQVQDLEVDDALKMVEEFGNGTAARPIVAGIVESLGKALQNRVTEPDILAALTRLPVDIFSLDLLNTLIGKNLIPDVPWLIHGYFAHAFRQVESMAVPQPGDIMSYADPSNSSRGTHEQARAVELLILFIRDLLRRNVMSLQELFFEVQEFRVRYIYIPQARAFSAEMLPATKAIEAAIFGDDFASWSQG
ncbi:MAG: hypothetical protein M1825_002200 [Sarcosagium campestre]|nr:MAG: hypothetical protein M1825_002200 [Sarcosagium campestre]